MYTDKVLEHFTNPQNLGKMEGYDTIGYMQSKENNDLIKIYLKIQDEIIEDIKFEVSGCGALVATGSVATQLVKNKKIDDALEIKCKDIIKELDGLPENRLYCAFLAQWAIRKAIIDYLKKQGLDTTYIEEEFKCESVICKED